jgi:hypothetical protein
LRVLNALTRATQIPGRRSRGGPGQLGWVNRTWVLGAHGSGALGMSTHINVRSFINANPSGGVLPVHQMSGDGVTRSSTATMNAFLLPALCSRPRGRSVKVTKNLSYVIDCCTKPSAPSQKSPCKQTIERRTLMREPQTNGIHVEGPFGWYVYPHSITVGSNVTETHNCGRLFLRSFHSDNEIGREFTNFLKTTWKCGTLLARSRATEQRKGHQLR